MQAPGPSSPERAILAALAQGALTLSELRERARTNWSTLYETLARLEERGQVRSFRVGRRRFLTAQPDLDLEGARDRALLRGAMERLARAVVALGRSTPAQLAEASGLPLRTTYAKLAQLRAWGLVESQIRAARIADVRATPRLLRALAGR